MYNSVILIFLLVVLVCLGLYLMFEESLINCVIALNIVSFIMASIYLLLNAPDVAMTEAAVGAGVSTVFFLGALKKVGIDKSSFKFNMPCVFAIFSVLCLLIYISIDFPEFGYVGAPVHSNIAEYYLSNSYTDLPNVVSVILASFRGYDTFGETLVVLVAAISISSIMCINRK